MKRIFTALRELGAMPSEASAATLLGDATVERYVDSNIACVAEAVLAPTGLDARPAVWLSGPAFTDCPIPGDGNAAP